MPLLQNLLRTTPEERERIRVTIVGISQPTISFYILVVLSTTIAAYGLLANSTAVVIGAMLVAPLMGPIFGIALALTTGDRHLLLQSLISEAAGAVLVVLLGAGIGVVTVRPDLGSEIVARTQPTLYDIIVAVASGLAGAYAMTNTKVSPALPGVAIATALVPPLATCGLCVSEGRWEWALGAFLLFFANLLAIELAAAFIFTVAGVAEDTGERVATLRILMRRFGISLVLLAAMGVFMTHTLLGIIAERRLSRALEAHVGEQMRYTMGAELSEIRHKEREDRLEVTAVVLTPQEFEPEQVARIEQSLRQRVHPATDLVIRSLISRDADRSGQVFVSQEERDRHARAAHQAAFLNDTTRILGEQLRKVPGARLADVRRERPNGETIITTLVRTPEPIEPAQVAEFQAALSKELGSPVRLVVRSILTRDADAQRYLYEKRVETKPLTGEALRFHRRLEGALRNQVKLQVEGATLKEFRFADRSGRLLVLAVARTPRSFTPADVDAMQKELRRYVDMRIDLIVRSDTAADTSATSYLSGFDDAKLGPAGAEASPAGGD